VIDYVALTVTGESLDPDELTLRLGVRPSKSFARGDVNVHPTPTEFGYWRLTLRRPGGELNTYLEELLDSLNGHESDVAEFARRHEVEIAIVADLTGVLEGEMTVSSSLLDRIAQTNAGLRFYWLYE
jgi:hypothetical protein